MSNAVARHRKNPESTPRTARHNLLVVRRLAAFAGSVLLCYSAVYAAHTTYYGEYDLGAHVPAHLPEAVAKVVSTAVELRADIPVSRRANNRVFMQHELSGIDLGNGYIFSAGHGLRAPNNTPLTSLECGNFVVSGTSPNGTAFSAPANQAVAEFTGINQTDVAMYRLSADTRQELADSGATLPETQTLRIAKEPPKRGDTLYFVNYEPTATGESRGPFADSPDLEHPAVFAGVVLGVHDGIASVVTDIRSYGDGSPDKVGRDGSSGGLVLNAFGELVGASDSGDSINAVLARISLDGKIGPFGLPGDGAHVEYVNLINQTTVDRWEALAAQAPACRYLPTAVAFNNVTVMKG